MDQIARTKRAYLHHLLDEDEDIRLDGFYDPEDHSAPLFETPRPTFEERQSGIEESDEFTRANLARGKRDVFLSSEAEEVLTWDHIELHLAEASSSWPRLIRALQEATVEAIAIIRKRDVGDSIPTPAYPDSMPNLVDQPTLSKVVIAWEAGKARGAWSVKVRNDYLAWMLLFQQISGDRPLGNDSNEDARTFKSVLLKLPANWRKKPAIEDLPVLEAIKKAEELGIPPMSTTTLNKAIGRLASFWNWAEAHFDGLRPLLFKGLTIRQAVSARDQRDSFSPEQISKAIFQPAAFGVCLRASLW